MLKDTWGKRRGSRGYRSAAQRRIRKLEEHIRELEKECAYDQLTGLLKSDGFENVVIERMEKMSHKNRSDDLCRAVGPVAIIFIDVDHFKEVNDTLGYEEGDEILRILANIIRDEDLVVRRSGAGDEFLIALFDMNKEAAGVRLVGMRTQFETAVSQSKKFPNLVITVSFSFGITEVSYPSDVRLLKEAVRDAEREMKEYKKARGMGR